MAGRTLSILIVFSLVSALAEAQVTLGRDVRQEIPVSSETEGATATLSVTQAQAVLPGGRDEYGSLITLFVPSSRLFWWMYQSSDGVSDPDSELKAFLDSFTFSVHPDEIACFAADGAVLEVRTSEMRVSNMNEAETKGRRLLAEELPGFRSGKTLEFQRVSLAQAIDRKFFFPKDFGGPPVQLKVGAVARSASGWRIEIKNDRGESKTVILSRDLSTVTIASE
jgi:hypothetical protein